MMKAKKVFEYVSYTYSYMCKKKRIKSLCFSIKERVGIYLDGAYVSFVTGQLSSPP